MRTVFSFVFLAVGLLFIAGGISRILMGQPWFYVPSEAGPVEQPAPTSEMRTIWHEDHAFVYRHQATGQPIHHPGCPCLNPTKP